MAFSNVWDDTFPPDSQQANLLGQDIRNLKSDIQQRMIAFGAGLFANRPTPDAASGPLPQGWGAVGSGVMYFAYDTGQIFYWNGAAWVEITGNFVFKSTLKAVNIVNHTGTTTTDVVYTLTIPAGLLTATSQWRITLMYRQLIASGAGAQITVSFGGVNLTSYLMGTTLNSMEMEIHGGNTGASNSQQSEIIVLSLPIGGGAPTAPVVNPNSITAIDTTAAVNLVVSVKSAANGDTQQFSRLWFESF